MFCVIDIFDDDHEFDALTIGKYFGHSAGQPI
jgi:hypothetical protein